MYIYSTIHHPILKMYFNTCATYVCKYVLMRGWICRTTISQASFMYMYAYVCAYVCTSIIHTRYVWNTHMNDSIASTSGQHHLIPVHKCYVFASESLDRLL